MRKSCKPIYVDESALYGAEKGGCMAMAVLDTLGLKCPQPVLKIAVKATDMKLGDTLEVLGDCPTFERDVRAWCKRLKKVLLSVKHEGAEKKRIQIQF